MYICEDMREEPEWAEYEEVTEDNEEESEDWIWNINYETTNLKRLTQL